MSDGRPILIAYDGSDGARAAVRSAGELLAARSAYVLTTWQPAALGVPAGDPLATDDGEIEAAAQAADTAAEGAALAAAAGVHAEPLAAPEPNGTWTAIVDAADRIDAAVIVVGTRGFSEIKSLVLGSVSNGVVHHTGRPVLVVGAAP